MTPRISGTLMKGLRDLIVTQFTNKINFKMKLTVAKQTMTSVQKLESMILDYFESEKKFNQTQSEHWLKQKNRQKKSITDFISQTRENELESRQLTLNF